MTHEQKPESAEFRTREAHRRSVAQAWQDEGMGQLCAEELADAELSEAEARGAAEQRRKDAQECQVVGQWQRSDGAWEDCDPNDLSSYIISGKTKRILYSDPRYASTLVADARTVVREHEQRRKDAEGAEPVGRVTGHWTDGTPMFDGWDTDRPLPLGAFVYDRPANVTALEDRVKELEGEKLANEGAAFERGFQGGRRDRYKQYERETAEAVAAEREKITNKLDEVAKHLARPWGSYLTEEGIAVKEACAARVEQEAAAIREGEQL